MAEAKVLRSPLSARGTQILLAIEDLSREFGYPPTVREVQLKLGYASPSSVYAQLKRLRHQGALTWREESPRTFVITSLGVESLRYSSVST